jgi:hypothetical protein
MAASHRLRRARLLAGVSHIALGHAAEMQIDAIVLHSGRVLTLRQIVTAPRSLDVRLTGNCGGYDG